MKILYSLILTSLSLVSFGQLAVNYQVQIVSFGINGCDDGFGGDEEPTWIASAKDDINTTFVVSGCYQQDANEPFTHNAGNTTLTSQNSTLATSIFINLDAWEDDNVSSSDRCTYDSGDDCHINTTFASISFRNDPHCQWNSYTLSDGSFSVVVRINWEYTTFDGGVNTIDCGTTIPLSAQGSGSWSVFSGTNGSFVDINNPATNFSGGANSSYTLLWNSLPGCINVYQPDTVQVEFISAPVPNLTASANTICEGTPVNFSAQNGSLYDWSVNTIGNVVLSDGSGVFTLTPTSSDNMVYVSVSNGTCSGIDSASFTVNASPTPTITDNGGVLSTQTFPVYLWYLNGSPIPGATNIDYTPTQPGSYHVEVVGANGCSGQSNPINITGIEELLSQISVFPNPTSGKITIDTEKNIDYIIVYNSIEKQERVSINNATIDLSDLSNGVYIVSISIENQIITKRIILSK